MADYKTLLVWQKGRALVKIIYLLTRKLPKEELFSLTNQVRRAAVSVPSNIAEGYNRYSDKEYIHFLRIANGSAAEVETQLLLCTDLEYLTEEEIRPAMSLIDEIFRMLSALILNKERGMGSRK